MKVGFIVFCFLTVITSISGCSGHQTNNEPFDLSVVDEKVIERAERLYTCSNFFNVVTEVRSHRNDPKEHTRLTVEMAESASRIAKQMLFVSSADKEIDSDRLVAHIAYKGKLAAYDMMAEIGGAPNPINKMDDLFLSCYKTIKREESIDLINSLSDKLSSKNK